LLWYLHRAMKIGSPQTFLSTRNEQIDFPFFFSSFHPSLPLLKGIKLPSICKEGIIGVRRFVSTTALLLVLLYITHDLYQHRRNKECLLFMFCFLCFPFRCQKILQIQQTSITRVPTTWLDISRCSLLPFHLTSTLLKCS